MISIPQIDRSEKHSIKSVTHFYVKYRLGSALKRAGVYKCKGVPVATLFQYLLSLVYTGKSMYEDMRSASPHAQGFCKDTVYRFLNSASVSWQAFLLNVAAKVIGAIDRLTSDSRRSVFIIDDTIYQVPYAKKAELVSRVYDHSEKGKSKYKWGYRMLTLCWSDGISLIPLAFRHLASADEKHQRTGMRAGLDKRSIAYRVRKEAVSKATDVLLLQLRAALKAGIKAKHVLFDTWFSAPATIKKVFSLGLHVTARVKDTSKIHYIHQNTRMSAKEIFLANRKRRGRSRYLLSVIVSLPTSDDDNPAGLPVRLVYVRNRLKRNQWIAILTTETDLTEEEVIALYGKRWDIEVFFKVIKSYLRLTGEFRQLSYDSFVAHTTVVMVRYIILSTEKRMHEDPRSLGELFFQCFDELQDLRFEEALMLLLSILAELLDDPDPGVDNSHFGILIDNFLVKLPNHFRACLLQNHVA